MPPEVHYSEYLRLDKILHAQFPESDKLQQPAHDEMLFIIIHQSYELWFKQLLFEVGAVCAIMEKPSLNDNSPELQTVAHRLSRCVTILKLLVHQIDVMETMNPMDFLDFRDMLRPASGFQSWQFKILEARLGLKYEQRFGQEYYISQLNEEEIRRVKNAEKEQSLLALVNTWLARMPFFEETENWKNFQHSANDEKMHPFWSEYKRRYRESLADAEKNNLHLFEQFFFEDSHQTLFHRQQSLSPAANRSALFIMLYRGYPVLQLPYQLLNQLLEIDEQLSTWRYRHMNMVHRTIGTRIGTGGSTGKDYLQSALNKHYIFKEIAQLTSFLIERKKLPNLSSEMERRLGFMK
ncbi:MAG: tryptophan 2,3-dioxygenase [Bacteroidetes bacterium]|nr:tryptophan 2,3-dioxygenase [Bacteroidota bacterium]MBS1974234.1 tryptophan 2,3-dioxygenase [Bacteroidota bacterium]